MTVVNVRWLRERDGELTITSPARHVKADELAHAEERVRASAVRPLRARSGRASLRRTPTLRPERKRRSTR